MCSNFLAASRLVTRFARDVLFCFKCFTNESICSVFGSQSITYQACLYANMGKRPASSKPAAPAAKKPRVEVSGGFRQCGACLDVSGQDMCTHICVYMYTHTSTTYDLRGLMYMCRMCTCMHHMFDICTCASPYMYV